MLSELSCASVAELAAGTEALFTLAAGTEALFTLRLGDFKIYLAPFLPGSRRTDKSKISHIQTNLTSDWKI